jgi:hypothetical protein
LVEEHVVAADEVNENGVGEVHRSGEAETAVRVKRSAYEKGKEEEEEGAQVVLALVVAAVVTAVVVENVKGG